MTAYYAYINLPDGQRLTMRGVVHRPGHIHFGPTRGYSLRLVYIPDRGMWKGTVEGPSGKYGLVGKYREAKSGVTYIHAWNPAAPGDFRPTVDLFPLGYRRARA
ncbi:MAG: hypothetical protein RXR82_09250 [Nitrososphaeria archaeon]